MIIGGKCFHHVGDYLQLRSLDICFDHNPEIYILNLILMEENSKFPQIHGKAIQSLFTYFYFYFLLLILSFTLFFHFLVLPWCGPSR